MRYSARKCLLSAILLSFIFALSMLLYLIKYDTEKTRGLGIIANADNKSYKQGLFLAKLVSANNHDESMSKTKRTNDSVMAEERRHRTSQNHTPAHMSVEAAVLDRLRVDYPLSDQWKEEPSYSVHAFYYAWYANPDHDGKYHHWNHRFLPHWNQKLRGKWPTGQHHPPGDIAANFYPELGAYSSRDPKILSQHMQQLRRAGVGVLSLSWYPPSDADDAGKPWDDMVPLLLDVAHIYSIKVNFHIEPYKGRNPASLRENVSYILTQYGSHPAFYRLEHKGRSLPLFFIYDSYLVQTEDWAELLSVSGSLSVRGTDLDAVFIGLVVEKRHKADMVNGGFDGFYTYFASNGFTHGSTWTNWRPLADFAGKHGLLFIPSVGPGYVDTEVRPWNKGNTKDRAKGKYYEDSFKAAIEVNPKIVSITSFNEWHEGTQIEPAVAKRRGGEMYSDYRPHGPDYYLDLTRTFVEQFEQRRSQT